MLIVIPSLILLFVAIVITFVIKFFWGNDEIKEKKVVKEEHLFDKNDPECC